LKIIDISIDKIYPYLRNPRINDKAVFQVAQSLEAFGFQQPIVVDMDHVIIAGHTRWAAAKELGLATVPILVADHLTKKQADAYRIADNKTAEFSEWNFELLRDALPELKDEFTGFDEMDINALMAPEKEKTQSHEKEPIVCPGCGYVFE